MARRLFFLLLFLGLAGFACAQSVLTGRVLENKSKVTLQGVKVENTKSHNTAFTDANGKFSITAAIGDVVIFTNGAYKPDTLYLTNLKEVEVFMDPIINQLQEVKVTNQQIKKNAGFSTQQETGVLGSKTVLYQTDDDGNYKGGIKVNIPDANDTKKMHDKKVAVTESMNDQIVKAFSADNLKKYLPLTGQEMANFIILYTPDINTYFGEGFNLVAYINQKYKEFMQIPADQRQSKSLTQLVPDKN